MSYSDLVLLCADVIQQHIVSRVNSSSGFSILADETTDISGIEQLSLGVRFIESAPKPVIREEFLGFTAIEGS